MIYRKTVSHPFVVFAIWLLLLSGGFWQLLIYSNTPGEAAKVSTAVWPGGTHIKRDPALATLVVFGHPRCPCSVATIGELERLLPHIKVKSYVVFVKPKTESDNWANEALWERAKAIAGVDVVLDDGGIEASRFGAKTSGQTFLYDKDGMLVFHGGITPARGHMGDSVGRDSILSFLESGKTTVPATSVFGCSLAKPERAIATEGVR